MVLRGRGYFPLKEADFLSDKIINVLVHSFKIPFDKAKEYI